jgi:hypothetical protein
MTTQEFWELTPKEFHALLQQYYMQEELNERRFAQLAYFFYNANFKPKKGFDDFILHKFREIPKLVQTWETQLEIAKMITDSYNKQRAHTYG